MKRIPLLFCLPLFGTYALASSLPIYLGTYTSESGSRGIYRTSLDSDTGKLAEPILVAEQKNPSFLVLSPDQKTLFSVGEIGESRVSSYAIQPDGKLDFLSSQPTQGAGACHLALDSTGRFLAVANYSGGNVIAFPVSPKGVIGAAGGTRKHEGASVNKKRQEKPHPHGIHMLEGKTFLVPDLGTDRVEVYHFGEDAQILGEKADGFVMPGGSGPRHCAVLGNKVWVVNELSCTVSEVTRSPKGSWTVGEGVSTLPSGWTGANTCAEILVHPNGKFLYATNRGHNSVARFAIESAGGIRFLGTTSSGGETPRGAALSSDGKYLVVANQDSGNLVAFSVDASSGDLKSTGNSVAISKAVSVVFVEQKR